MTPLTAISPVSLPAAAVGLAAVGALYALHHLRVRPEQRPTATLIFWRAAVGQQRSRTLSAPRFRHPRTFALLAAMAGLLSLALSADRWGAGRSRPDAVVVDCGSSTAAPRPDGTTVLAAASARAARQSARAATAPWVIAAGPQPAVLGRPDEPTVLARQRLASLVPAAMPSGSSASIQLADGLLGRDGGSIDWYTDRAALPPELPPRIAARVRLHRLAPPDASVLSLVTFEPDPLDPAHGRLRVRLARSGPAAAPATVALVPPAGATQTRSVPPFASAADAVFPGLVADGSPVVVRLVGTPGSPLEQAVHFHLPRHLPLTFTLVGDVPGPLRDVIRSVGTVRPAGTPGAILVLGADAGVRPLGGPALRIVSAGGIVSGELATAGPAYADLDLEHARVAGAVALPPALTPVLRVGGATVIGLDPTASVLTASGTIFAGTADLPRRAVFPVLMQRLFGHLAGWSDPSPAVEAARATADPLWTSDRAALVYADPAPVTPDPPPAVAGRLVPRPSWAELLLLATLGLAVLEALLLAARRTV